MANGKRQAKISKEVVGAFQTLLHNLGVGRNFTEFGHTNWYPWKKFKEVCS